MKNLRQNKGFIEKIKEKESGIIDHSSTEKSPALEFIDGLNLHFEEEKKEIEHVLLTEF